jgi:iron complex transport system ATP-binding protein
LHTQASSNPVLLTARDLSWRVAGKSILKNINLSIAKGRCVGLIGPNGAGKSSLLRCLYRYNKPSTGCIEFNGKNIWQLNASEYAKRVAVVLQETPSQFNLSVFDVVALGLVPHKSVFSHNSTDDKHRVSQAIAKVGLQNQTHQNFESLSGGEKQRALIARAIVQQPQLLIMDEPTSHLDIKYQIQVMEQAKSLGVSILTSFHDLNLAAAMCDELIVIKHGEIMCAGVPSDIINETMLSDVFGVCAQVTNHPQQHQNGDVIPHITYFYDYNAHE